jgi:pullulanase
VGLAGTLRGYRCTRTTAAAPADQIDYGGQPAGYVSQPGEVVNYVENHDNQTLFDSNALQAAGRHLSREDRARVQVLGAGARSPSARASPTCTPAGAAAQQERWTATATTAATGSTAGLDGAGQRLRHRPAAAQDNGASWPLMRPLLADPSIKPGRPTSASRATPSSTC